MQCGLDRGKRGSHTPIVEQEGIFEQQVQMAQELNRPVSVSSLHFPQHSVRTARQTQLQLHWLMECWAAKPACFAGPDVHTAGTRKSCCLEAWPDTVQVHCVQHFGKLQQLLQKHGPFPAGAQAPLQPAVFLTALFCFIARLIAGLLGFGRVQHGLPSMQASSCTPGQARLT